MSNTNHRAHRKGRARVRRIFHARLQSCLARDAVTGRQAIRHGRLDPVEVLDRYPDKTVAPPRSGELMVCECRRCGALVTTAWRTDAGYTQNKDEIKRRKLEAAA